MNISPLLTLPREPHDRIYAYYLYQKEGYVYDHVCGEMRARIPQRNYFALMYTCNTLAKEMKGVALKTNLLIFEPYLSQNHKNNADGELLSLFFALKAIGICI
jgi:hypothetical protein